MDSDTDSPSTSAASSPPPPLKLHSSINTHSSPHPFRLRSLRATYSLPWGQNIPLRHSSISQHLSPSLSLPLPQPQPLPQPLPPLCALVLPTPTISPVLLPLDPQPPPLHPPPSFLNALASRLSSSRHSFNSLRPSLPPTQLDCPPQADHPCSPDDPVPHSLQLSPNSPSPDDPCSPSTSPLTGCSSCRSPLSRTSSCSSLHTLSSSRSPLFDDLDTDTPVSGSLELLEPPNKDGPGLQPHSWPVFEPPCDELLACGCPKESKETLLDAARPRRVLRRSYSGSMNLLVPTPLATDEPDPLLAPPEPDLVLPLPAPVLPRCRVPRRKRRPEESLLTKSLRRLSRKLPNIQWGILSPRPEEDLLGGLIEAGGTDEGLEQEEMEEEEEAGRRIARLVKSWTSDTIQPQNRHSGRFIDDPEMEWSSMMVQLETFSPPSPSTSRRRRSSRPRPSRSLSTTTPTPTPPTTRQRRRRISPDPVRRRVVANPLHLLQLTLELEMMRKKKIGGPLRQRAVRLVVVRKVVVDSGAAGGEMGSNGIGRGSPLKFEIT